MWKATSEDLNSWWEHKVPSLPSSPRIRLSLVLGSGVWQDLTLPLLGLQDISPPTDSPGIRLQDFLSFHSQDQTTGLLPLSLQFPGSDYRTSPPFHFQYRQDLSLLISWQVSPSHACHCPPTTVNFAWFAAQILQPDNYNLTARECTVSHLWFLLIDYSSYWWLITNTQIRWHNRL